MAAFTNTLGTTQQAFAIGGPLGPSLQNDPMSPLPVGAVAVYSNLSVYGNLRAADPVVDADVVTLGFLKALAALPEPEAENLYSGGKGSIYGSC